MRENIVPSDFFIIKQSIGDFCLLRNYISRHLAILETRFNKMENVHRKMNSLTSLRSFSPNSQTIGFMSRVTT